MPIQRNQTRWTPLGDMNKSMVVYQLDTTPTASGGTTDTPVALFTLRVALTPLRGNETFLAGCQFRRVTHRINSVFRSGINGKMYGVYDGRTFEFTSVINVDEENRETEIIAIEDTT